MSSQDKNFVIYDNEGTQITLMQAYRLESTWDHLYVGIGEFKISNPYFCIAMLNSLSDSNQISSFAYVGPTLEKFPSEEGVVY